MGYVEIMNVLVRKLEKPYEEFTLLEKAYLADIVYDAARGRYSKLLNMGKSEIAGFSKYIESHGDFYEFLKDGERWAYEDSYFDDLTT